MNEKEMELLDRLQNVSCKLDFQETMTFIFAISIIIFSVGYFFRSIHESKSHHEKK